MDARIWGPAVGLITVFAGAAAVGFSTGVPGGFSGGLLSGGQSCAACHVAETEGTGSVEVLGAPMRYQPNGLYELAVRVTDPDQAGAGFQLSVETEAGVSAGVFEIIDSQNTALSSNDPRFVTHTENGYLKSVLDWEDESSSATFTVRWRAPEEDLGEVTFYAAGNAVNANGWLDGDHVYTTSVSAPFGSACPSDLNGDGVVETTDLILLLDQWRTGPGIADLNGDGEVEVRDLAKLLMDWGSCEE